MEIIRIAFLLQRPDIPAAEVNSGINVERDFFQLEKTKPVG